MRRLIPGASLVAALVLPAAALAQAPDTSAAWLDPFEPPASDTVLCHQIPPSQFPAEYRDSTHMGVWEMKFGTPAPHHGILPPDAVLYPREIAFIADTTGRVFYLHSESNGFTPAGLPLGTRLAVAVFPPTRDVEGAMVAITVDTAQLHAGVRAGDIQSGLASARSEASRPLTESELARMHELGAWVWTRRCPPIGRD